LTDVLVLETARGPIVLRPEQPADGDFLYTLFRRHTPVELATLPIDAATREALVGMQFNSQTATYRAQYPAARFDIVERDGTPIGRLVVDDGAAAACIVDFALLPEHCGAGLGTAILAGMLARLAGWGRPVHCQVLCTNEPSLRMCRRVGFVHIGGELPFLQLEWRPSAGGAAAAGRLTG
jgi:RimJ/RimL family protein N-acetyltransferase